VPAALYPPGRFMGTLWIGILNLCSENLGALNTDMGYTYNDCLTTVFLLFVKHPLPTGLLVHRPRAPQWAHTETRSENVCSVFEIGQGIHSRGLLGFSLGTGDCGSYQTLGTVRGR
jgi:hypothetical protein